MTTSPTDRERAWRTICDAALGEAEKFTRLGPEQFTAAAVAERAGVGSDNTYRLLMRLAEAGLVRREGRARPSGSWYSDLIYELTAEGRTAARRTLTGWPPPAAVSDPRAGWQQDAWTAMRIHKRFTAQDVARLTAASYDQVYRYCQRLVRAGILRKAGRQGKPGSSGSYNLYGLRRDPGPEPPLRYGPQAKTRSTIYADQ